MARAGLSSEIFSAVQQVEDEAVVQPSPEQECFKVVLIGSVEGVREMIHRLHLRGIVEAGAWSRLLPVPERGEVMSILLHYRRRG